MLRVGRLQFSCCEHVAWAACLAGPGGRGGLPKKVGGFARHSLESLPGPPGPARLQNAPPKIRPECVQVPCTRCTRSIRVFFHQALQPEHLPRPPQPAHRARPCQSGDVARRERLGRGGRSDVDDVQSSLASLHRDAQRVGSVGRLRGTRQPSHRRVVQHGQAASNSWTTRCILDDRPPANGAAQRPDVHRAPHQTHRDRGQPSHHGLSKVSAPSSGLEHVGIAAASINRLRGGDGHGRCHRVSYREK